MTASVLLTCIVFIFLDCKLVKIYLELSLITVPAPVDRAEPRWDCAAAGGVPLMLNFLLV